MRVTLFGQGMEKRRGETEPGEFSQFQSFLKRELAHLKRGLPPYGRGCAGKTGAAAREFQGDARVAGLSREAIESARKEDNVHHASRAPNPQSSRAAYMAAWRRKSNEKLVRASQYISGSTFSMRTCPRELSDRSGKRRVQNRNAIEKYFT